MSAITTAKDDLAVVLRDMGLSVITHEPDRPSPPQVIIKAAGEYLTKSETFTARDLNLILIVTVRDGSASVVIEQLDDLIDQITLALDDIARVGHWHVTEPVTLLGEHWTIPAVEIHLTYTI